MSHPDPAKGAAEALRSIARWQRLTFAAAALSTVFTAIVAAAIIFIAHDYLLARQATIDAMQRIQGIQGERMPGASLRRPGGGR